VKTKIYFNKKYIAEAKICIGIFSKGIGLMFSNFQPLLFVFSKEKIIPLHMLFVFYPIDVVFLDKNKIIVDIKQSFKPFSFYTPEKKAMCVLELKNGFVDENNLQIGYKLNWK